MLNRYQQATAYLILMGTLAIGTPLSKAEETVIAYPTSPTLPATPAPATTAADSTLTPQVTRAAFTTVITAREPNDQLTRVSAGQNVYYFTELLNLQGRIITHRWEKDGAFQLGLQFPVGGQRWRVHSNKMIAPNLPGVWKVSVINDDGSVLHQDTLLVEAITASDPVTTAPETLPETPAAPPVSTPKPEPAPQAIWDTLPR
ncbi:DUF2914 domain-containing protein [Thiothrix subterranea]|uniref:DUF2914 domain-containing protein n=1 Tax=Thiothrix subterranea TaxID=2735563 RepID=A0AA51MNJ5_9GAMM|nr:DUF2914 domain-containing protein [Thiothrix subterranea]MDQ5768412.1 DUF2914 domain-containing protein [Thiothrix subterranea]WML86999.1 DUF2914 domain-containing protein [Thiothrix subterranea]